MPTYTLSSDVVPPQDRLSYLLEHFARHVHRLEWRPPAGRDPLDIAVRGKVSTSPLALTADFTFTGGSIERTLATAETAMGQVLYLYRERAQTAWFTAADGRSHRLRPGSLVLYPSDLSAYRGGVAPNDNFAFQYAAIPLATVARFAELDTFRTVQHLSGDTPFHALLSSYFAAWCERHPLLDQVEAEASLRTLLDLLAVASRQMHPGQPAARLAVSEARRQAAETYIDRAYTDPALTPERVARHLGISVRQLHLDFEPAGISVARRISSARIEAARRALAADPTASITDIAFDSGFDGLSTFYRAFKSATGMTASEYREQFRHHTTQVSEIPE